MGGDQLFVTQDLQCGRFQDAVSPGAKLDLPAQAEFFDRKLKLQFGG